MLSMLKYEGGWMCTGRMRKIWMNSVRNYMYIKDVNNEMKADREEWKK